LKKILILFVFCYGQLVALEKESTLKIYHHIFAAMTSPKSILVHVQDKEYIDVFKYSKKIRLTKGVDGSDIVLITSKTMLRDVLNDSDFSHDRPILFATDYHFLKKSKDLVGAFYWKKGRTQLIFIRSRLRKHNIVLPDEFEKYTIEEL
jgi:hypothetical protein